MKMKKILCTLMILCGIWVYQKAKADNSNPPQQIKSFLTRMKAQLAKNEDSFPMLITEAEQMTASCTDPAATAVLHTIVAQMYSSYYADNRWKIEQRTPIIGYVPADIQVWTGNIFTDTIQWHVNKSLVDAPLLQKTKVSEYQSIMEPGKDTPSLRPTLFDFLSYQDISILEQINWQSSNTSIKNQIKNIYQNLIDFRETANNPKALLLAKLDYLNYLYGANNTPEGRKEYMEALNRLEQKYASQPFSVEIAIAKLSLYERTPYNWQKPDSILGIMYNFSKEVIGKYPQYERTGILKNKLNRLIQPNLTVSSEKTVVPGKELKLKLKYKNISSATILVYKSNLSPVAFYSNLGNEKQATATGEKIKEISVRLDVPEPYTSQDTTISIPLDKLGIYEYRITTAGKVPPIQKIVSVSRLFAATRTFGNNTVDFLVTDFESGKPVDGAQVILYSGKRDAPTEVKTLTTDKDGLAKIDMKENTINAYRVISGNDKYSTLSPLYAGWDSNHGNLKEGQMTLFTDRGLYRPGQTVFFKGIAYIGDPDDPHVISNKSYTVRLRDANGQEIATRTLKTNEYGSFHASFVLPQETLNGTFSILTDQAISFFQVEEYKRPTFAVDFLPIKKEVMFGDNVYLQGTARTYSGANLDGATVQYSIIRRPLWFRYTGYPDMETQVAHGTATVGDNGTFTFSFKPEKEMPMNDNKNIYYRYEAIAVVTNSVGESQEGKYYFSVGDRSMRLSVDIPDKWNKDSDKEIIISATNLNGQEVSAQGKYTLSLLEDEKDKKDDNERINPFFKTPLPVKEEIYQGTFVAGKPLDTQPFAQFPSGRYRIKMEALDSQNRPVTSEEEFILYGLNDKRPPVYSHKWVVPVKTTVLPGETAEIIFGTSVKKAFVLYEIINDGVLLDRKRIVLSDENRTFRIPYMENFGNGVVVSFTYTQDGQLYNQHVPILKKFPDRKLTITPQTFRDKLRPGQQETWSFRITDADSLPVMAEMQTSMYDAALDAIRPYAWSFNPIRHIFPTEYYFNAADAYRGTNGYSSAEISFIKVPQYQFDRFNWLIPLERYSTRSFNGAPLIMADASVAKDEMSAGKITGGSLNEMVVVGYGQVSNKTITGKVPSQNVLEEETNSPVQIRKNFNETAFFYPNLLTNKEGEVMVSFTLPESNTTWKFMSLAYTKDLDYGSLEKEVISQKELMVVPNLPRFLRQGDKVSLATQILNLSAQTLSGNVKLELFNPETNENISSLSMPSQSFSVPAGGSTQAFWSLSVPAGLEMIGCRIIAETPKASDGEQTLLPILPDEIMITESKPFILSTPGEKTIQTGWNATNSTLRPFSMTLEVTGNPIWYAVQALPTVTLPRNEDAVSWFSAYYTNTLASYIAQSYPKVKTMIEQWEKQGGTSETLYSNLQKNQELKNILLEETPWVLAAKNETEQKQQLALLFNINHANDLKRQALNKILKLQNDNGGWSWYPGMPTSRTITLYILKGMAQLTHLGAIEYGEQEKTMQINALNALDKNVSEEYEALKKNNPQGIRMNNLTSDLIEYLFVRSAYRDIPPYGNSIEAVRFYTDIAKKNWIKQSLYSQALIAQLLFRNGDKSTANTIVDALKDLSTQTEEMGMYWANNKRFTDFFISPVSVQCQIMDAFEEITPNVPQINAMKQWLLIQKQTQNWGSVPSTVNAIYALLSTGSDWLADNGNCIVTWGNNKFETASGEAGLGYIQETVRENKITPDMGTVTIQKTGDAPAWGAVYRQYFEKVNNVKSATGDLSVEKKLFVTVTGNQGAELRPVTASNPLKIGDKVTVRLIITTDREMDYVQLKDMRAGCFEPVNQLSGTEIRDGLWFYQSPEDASQNFFFNKLPKGTYVMEYAVYVARSGEYSGGISTIQCLYAPEFVSHTEGNEIIVK
ncbi:alpha-2-macroglobulin family protein [Parabacteroides pacaensis]|uniref:alpha-2-macroglobulin family protein n=1 Tax=Parabacteroides pacaensis TaxID=2086575 RepID=UPI000D0FA712|nr:alpha-2-macroglobulin family protein [Parabacteroides pacaensis]